MEACDSLDCRLKVSGMVADSIMMGIVNSAMEEAYMKVCSKEGDLECLNEKSRFCELALMQLEWCLKFIQEEVDSYIVESSRERENLVSDLTNARDRMQKRLEETLLAIAEKDKELTERLENESKLRHALELKEEEISALHATLELERTKSQRVREFVLSNQICQNNVTGHDIFEMKNSMDEQFWSIKQNIEDGLEKMADGIRIGGSCDDPIDLEGAGLEDEGNANLDFLGHDFNFEKEVLNSNPRMELNMVIQQMGVDIDILKDMLEISFEMMDYAISSSKWTLMEEQWERNLERETVALVTQNFIKEAKENFQMKFWDSQGFSSANWPAFMDELANLRRELEVLDVQNKIQSAYAADQRPGTDSRKQNSVHVLQRYGKSDSALELEQLSMDEIPEEVSVTQPYSHATEVIQNHEHVKQKKTDDINWPTEEIVSERRLPPVRKDKDIDALKNMIPKKGDCGNILQRSGKSDSALRFKELIHSVDPQKEDRSENNPNFVAKMIKNHEDIIKKKTEEINWLRGEIFREKERPPRRLKDMVALNKIIPKVISRLDHIIKESEKLCVTTADLREKLRQLEQEREDWDLQAVVTKETWAVLFRGLAEEFRLKLDTCVVQDLIRNDISTVFLREMAREWNNEMEKSNMDSLIREEVCKTVLSEAVKDFQCNVSFNSAMHQYGTDQDILVEDLPSTSDFSQLWEDLTLDEIPEQWDTDMGVVGEELEELNRMLDESDEAFFSVSSKLEKALQQITASKDQLKELSSSLVITVGGQTEAHFRMFSQGSIVQDGDASECLGDGVNQQTHCQMFSEESIVQDGDPKGRLNQQTHCQILSDENIVQDGNPTGCLNQQTQYQMFSEESIVQDGDPTECLGNGVNQQIAFDSFITRFTGFTKGIKDLEHMINERLEVCIMRLQDVDSKFDPLIQHVGSLKRNELLYRKAFTRRCYDLQTAEAEVDLLGDEVDELLSLLEKLYRALYHYSPVLQLDPELMGILELIRKELTGEAKPYC